MGRALSVIGVPTGAGPYTAALEGLTALDEYELRNNPQTPALYASGVRYTKEATNKWRPVINEDHPDQGVLATKLGDCEALSTWRAAELRVSGEDPNASVVVYKTGPSKYHAVVLRGDYTLEDPSVKLGMKPPTGLLDFYDNWNGAVAAAPPTEDQPMVMGTDDVASAVIGVNDAPGNPELVCVIVGTDEGFKGRVRIPLTDGRAIYAETSTSRTKQEARDKSDRVVGVIGAFWDDLSALLPSAQAQAAIRIAKNQHVQNLANDAYQAGRKALGLNPKPRRPVVIPDAVLPPGAGPDLAPSSLQTDEQVPDMDDGSGNPYDAHGLYDADQADGGGQFVEVNGVLCGVDEIECLGAINAYMARNSTPHVGAFNMGFRSGGGRAPAGGGGRPAGGGGGGLLFNRQPSAQAPAGFHAAPLPTSSPMLPVVTPPAYGGGMPFGGGFGGLPPGVNPQSAQAAALLQLQRNAQANQMLSQSGGGYGGGGGGYDGGGGYTAADQQADAQADADLFNAYYQNQAFQDLQTQYFDQAVETSPDAFFGTVNPLEADQLLMDDTVPAQ